MLLHDEDPPGRQVEKMQRITGALIDRIDRLEETRGSAWSVFQAAVALEQEVLARRRELERVLADLSQRNRELAAARAAAEHANRSKTRFLRAAGHDLVQPLAAARLFLSTLTGTALDQQQQDLTQRLSGALESVEQLMSAVLEVSRLDSQGIELHRLPIPIGDLFDRLATEFTPMAEARGLRLRFVHSGAVIESDPVLLRRIAQNLVSNAIKYTDRGGVVVGIRRQGAAAWLSVHDSGTGIAEADKDRIFEEFQRVGHDPGKPGMGLGLSIVHRACAKLGHPLRLTSSPGRGSVFAVGLPVIGMAGQAPA